MSEMSVFQMVENTVVMVPPHWSQKIFSAPNMALAADDRAFQSAMHSVLMAPQIFENEASTCSPFSAHHADRAPNISSAAPLMTPHTARRNALTACQALKMAFRAFSAPMPTLSKIVPMRLLSPLRKAMKSSMSRAINAITAMMPTIFILAKSSALSSVLTQLINVMSLPRAT